MSGAEIDVVREIYAAMAAIQFGRTRGVARESGTEFDIAEVHRWTLHEGKAIAAHFAIDTPAMLRALGTDGGS